jgi:hypothetical protein
MKQPSIPHAARCVVVFAAAILVGASMSHLTKDKTPGQNSTTSGDVTKRSRLERASSSTDRKVPKFVPGEAQAKPPDDPPLAVETVPGRPDYDPMRFRLVVHTRDIFAQEPRSNSWSATIEQNLQPMLARDLKEMVPAVTDIAIECRTSICKFTWQGPAELNLQISTIVRALYGGAGGAHGQTPNEFYAVFRGGFIGLEDDPEAVIRKLIAQRANVLKGLRGIAEPKKMRFVGLSWPKE